MATFEEWSRGQNTTMSEHNISERAWHARDAEIATLQAHIDAARKLIERWRWAANLGDHSQESPVHLQQIGWSQCADELLAVLDGGTDGQ